MSSGLLCLLCALALLAGAMWLISCIRIVSTCPQCESVRCEIYDSSVSEAWLDCVCHQCGYKWREK